MAQSQLTSTSASRVAEVTACATRSLYLLIKIYIQYIRGFIILKWSLNIEKTKHNGLYIFFFCLISLLKKTFGVYLFFSITKVAHVHHTDNHKETNP